jgi:molybdopterin-containing oxidoreductase family iron-sulfur binding subunit
MQAEILALYDPDRSKSITNDGKAAAWGDFLAVIARERERWKADGGAGLRLLTGHVTSPTLLWQMAALLKEFPNAKWHAYEPLAPAPPQPLYDLARAEVILAIECDFLGTGPAQLKYARDFATRRRAAQGSASFNRLYVAESSPTLTGARADHRFPLGPRALGELGKALATGTGLPAWGVPILDDLRKHQGRSLILAGQSLPPEVREFARKWNQALQIAEPPAMHGGSLAELIHDLEGGKIHTVVILEGNPSFNAPVDFQFAENLKRAPLRIRLGLYEDETSTHCQWHLPSAHALEAWSDARAVDGTATIMQPLIEPLYEGRSTHELLAILSGKGEMGGYEIVRQYWLTQHPGPDFETFWRKSVHDGWVKGSAVGAASPTTPEIRATTPASGLELIFNPGPTLRDGTLANNAWLQELPQPFTKLTWDNAALISTDTAKRLGLASGDVVDLKYRGRSVRAPVWVLPGEADDCVTVHLGYGRSRAGGVGNGVGFNAYSLRTSDAPWGGPGLELIKTGLRHSFASTQQHQNMEGRDQIRTGTLAEFKQHPAALAQTGEPAPGQNESLYPAVAYHGHAWGMAIDLGTCIGCNVCTIACQAENNIPVVGKEQVARGREMHWIRVDNYFEGALANPRLHFQPVPCMHCENAPCELVCPVAATAHSSEGLNQMVYNRCVGTRYCSNNCPYKVRRFNFLEFDRNRFENQPVLRLLRNPDVTVRSRGVMEKCTYCVQRINRVRLDAEKQNRPIRDGEIVPACAQACPAEAISFGDLNDPQSRVSKLKVSPLNYGLLAELNTRPRTTYLAKVRNPNPDLEKE